jgi:phospholipase C
MGPAQEGPAQVGPAQMGPARTGLAMTVLAVGLSALSAPASATALEPAPATTAALPIHHVVEVMLENHTFDNLFGQLPGADGIPAGTTFPSPTVPGARVGPLLAPPDQGSVGPNLDNSRAIEEEAMDHQPGGTFGMGRYTVTPYEGLASITVFPPSVDPNLQFLGRHYALAEANFQPEIAPTTPNVIAALAGTSDGWYSNDDPPVTDKFHTIFDELQAAGRSWDIFFGFSPSLVEGTYWGGLVPAGHTGQLLGTGQFITDAALGRLPDFSLVRPGYGYSEESPEDTSLGDAWLGQLVLAVMNSPEWPSTAIFVTYDEGGGFWDHVSPPQVDAAGYGTRTPMVVISPYTPTELISETTTNLSVLSFMQALWHLPALDNTNAQAPDLLRYFDFNQPPGAPQLPPAAPPDTLRLLVTGPGSVYYTAPLGQRFTVDLAAETPGLGPDAGLNGVVTLSVSGPPGAQGAKVPGAIKLRNGTGWFNARLPAGGYWRVKAVGPDHSLGWVTIGVGVNANTP